MSCLWGGVELGTKLEGIGVLFPFISTPLYTNSRQRGVDIGRWDEALPTLFNSGGEALETPPGVLSKTVQGQLVSPLFYHPFMNLTK